MQANYGVTVTGLEWRKDGLWNVKAKGGESLGVFDAVIIADKGLASARFLAQTGLPPPLGIFLTFIHIKYVHSRGMGIVYGLRGCTCTFLFLNWEEKE